VTDWRNHPQWKASRCPARKGPSFPTSCQVKTPRRDKAIERGLSERFRSGDIYAYSFERGAWLTWATVEDFDATERSTRVQLDDGTYTAQRTVRNTEARDAGHGPRDWKRADLEAWLGLDCPKVKRPGKADMVAMLRRILDGTDWEVDELQALVDTA
jgi:hypothetical protein